MQDTKLFDTILGIQAPCRISRAALDTSGERVDLWAEHDRTPTWPRVACPTHGVRQVAVPWAAPRSRFTLLLERLIIDLILQCSTVTGACRIAGISWDEAWGVRARAVTRGRARRQARPIRYIGVDEKAFRKGHRYHTIVCDLAQATVESVAEDRRVECLGTYYDQLTAAQRDALTGVAMDRWEPYIQATRTRLPAALRALWTYRQGDAVRRFFDQWYAWAIRSRLEPVTQVARMIQRHRDGVLRFVTHPITNGVAEGLNSKIMSIKRKAGGFRNPENFTTAIYFHCGGLDLHPR